ncbi:hypothetical protein CEN49_17285 [Fischerella thermalis CCMEE 5273]|nr:hypothetical protein CEN49_17285 [Fischerella thermalis CCMEE 5273]
MKKRKYKHSYAPWGAIKALNKRKQKKVLKLHVKYTSAEGYAYQTDKLGPINSVDAELTSKKAKRNSYAQRNVGREDRQSNDHGGHLIASMFGGSGNIDNLVPMNKNLNQVLGLWMVVGFLIVLGILRRMARKESGSMMEKRKQEAMSRGW